MFPKYFNVILFKIELVFFNNWQINCYAGTLKILCNPGSQVDSIITSPNHKNYIGFVRCSLLWNSGHYITGFSSLILVVINLKFMSSRRFWRVDQVSTNKLTHMPSNIDVERQSTILLSPFSVCRYCGTAYSTSLSWHSGSGLRFLPAFPPYVICCNYHKSTSFVASFILTSFDVF